MNLNKFVQITMMKDENFKQLLKQLNELEKNVNSIKLSLEKYIEESKPDINIEKEGLENYIDFNQAMDDFLTLLDPFIENTIAKINIGMTDFSSGKSLNVQEKWSLNITNNCVKSIIRNTKTYKLGNSPPQGTGLFFWYLPKMENEYCERIRIYPIRSDDDEDDRIYGVSGEIWRCNEPGPYIKGSSKGTSIIIFKWL